MDNYVPFKSRSTILVILVMLALYSLLTLSSAIADFSLEDWQHVKTIGIPLGLTEKGLVEVAPDPDVYSGASAGLADLRIIQAKDQEIPYELVIETGRRDRSSIPVKIRDLGFVPGQYSSFVAELGREGLLHNEIEVSTDSENFQRDVIVEGSNDNTTWTVLRERSKIFDFTLKERNFTSRFTRVGYPESTVRFLRVRIIDNEEKPLNITGASVYSVVENPAEEASYPATIIQRTEDSAKRTSLIVIDLGLEGLPTNRVTIRTPQVNFYREVTLEGTGDASALRWDVLQRPSVMYSYDTPKFVGDQLTLSYPETTFRYLRLSIQNEDNPILPVEEVDVFGVSRKLIFEAQPDAPYRLYYGNPKARSPSYELERILPFLETENLPVGTLGPQMENPEFSAKEKRLPFSERYAWLITVMVAAAAVALAFLLFGVVRKAKKVLPPPD